MKFHEAVTLQMVKNEAERRILLKWPIWRQLNAMRDGAEVMAVMARDIDAIRTASNRIEALSPIPADYRHDRHWG